MLGIMVLVSSQSLGCIYSSGGRRVVVRVSTRTPPLFPVEVEGSRSEPPGEVVEDDERFFLLLRGYY